MARKSALENLHRRLEDTDSDRDVNVDITVVIESDGDAAEDIIEATESEEVAADVEDAIEAHEDLQEETTEMVETAEVLRQYGLNAGMAAMLNVLLPMEAYGIVMPATESLDMSGKNQAVANRLAAALEDSSKSFWESTKNFFKKIWVWITDQLVKLGTMMGRMSGKIERMGKALEKRTWNADRAKDKKVKTLKTKDTDVNTALGTLEKSLDNAIKEEGKRTEKIEAKVQATLKTGNVSKQGPVNPTKEMTLSFSKEIEVELKQIKEEYKKTFTNDVIKNIGLEWKETGKDNDDNLSTKEVSGFFDTDDREAKTEDLNDYKKGGSTYNNVLGICKDGMAISLLNKFAKTRVKEAEKLSDIENIGEDKNSEGAKAAKKIISLRRSCLGVISKFVGRSVKVCNKYCGLYLSNGRVLIGCSIPDGSTADFSDK